MLSANQIRRQFIDFFVERCGHTYVPSSPVVPHDDPTLLFTNAGMNQFKDVFLAVGDRPYTRAVNSQKCIRAGGKHNDLDDVGKDTYHHTFFEMLGNWSFGDYFKVEAIDWAWDLLVNVWKLDPTRLHATYFGGNEKEGLAPDHEARDLWRRYLPDAHIHPGNMKDNFWEMGETGPCGPCSEIHVDRTPDKSGASLVNGGDARVMEIWNLVFMQFNRGVDGRLTPLPAKHVDTGMGFERVVSVIQGKDSNYDTDVFTPLFDAIRAITGAPAYTGSLTDQRDIAYRVIADHARCLTFAITDGAMPSNEGRGYVLRRILRRAVRYGRQHLGQSEPFLYRLVEVIVREMSSTFPELTGGGAQVASIIRDEEESFGKTLDRGIELFDAAAHRAQHSGRTILPGEDAFKLYDTFGFPLDLTQLMAQERGMSVDVAGFERLMDDARARSRADGGAADARQSLIELVQQGKFAKTEFVGYDQFIVDPATVRGVVRLEGNQYVQTQSLKVGDVGAIVTDKTPFYAESGGQVGDIGLLHTRTGAVFRVTDVQKVGEVFFHLGKLEDAAVKPGAADLVGESMLLEIDQPRRRRIMAHHTTTHLLNWALREVLGDHVMQKGSLVDADKTRFDFAHGKALADEELERAQRLVNDKIALDLAVSIDFVPQEQAMGIHGLRAVFGEKYPPVVRVVSIGAAVADLLKTPDRPEWRQYSIEFCGGTHLQSTRAAQQFVITDEEAVGKGVRRIIAIAGEAAAKAQARAGVLMDRLDSLAKHPGDTLEQDLAAVTESVNAETLPLLDRSALRAKVAELQKVLKEMKKVQSRASEEQVVDEARKIADAADDGLIVAEVPGADAQTLRKAMDVIRAKRPDAAMLLAARDEDKLAFLAAVPKPLIDKGLKAGDWVREVAKAAGGGGGGKPDMAQAGGKDPEKLGEALAVARGFATAKLS